MATYVPNATQTTEPLESQTVESAALEFRTLKARVNALDAAVAADDLTDLRVPETSIAVLPAIASRAGKVLGFDAGGNPAMVDVAGATDPSLRSDLAASSGANLVRYLPAGTGAVATDVQTKFRQTVSVFDFMTPAQIADVQANTALLNVTAAIQSALTAANKVYFPAGTYLCDTVSVKANQFIHGDGKSSIIKQNSTTGASYGTFYADSGSASAFLTGITIRDIQLLGQVATLGFSEFQHLIGLNGVDGVLIDNVWVTGFRGDGIYLGSSPSAGVERHNRNVVITNCVIDGVNNDNRNGISIIDGDGILIEHNVFKNCTRSNMPGAIDVEPNGDLFPIVRNINIVNNTFTNIGGSAGIISFAIGANTFTVPPENYSVVGNTFVGATRPMMVLVPQAVDRGVPLNLVIANNTYSGAGRPFEFARSSLGYVDGVTITGNTFTYGAAAVLAFTNTATCINTVIANNVFRSASGGLALNGNASFITVSNNVFVGNPAINFGVGGGVTSNIAFQNNMINGAGTITSTGTDAGSTNSFLNNTLTNATTVSFRAWRNDFNGTVVQGVAPTTFNTTTLPDSFPTGVFTAILNGDTGVPAGIGSTQGVLTTYRLAGTSGYERFTYQTFVHSNNTLKLGSTFIRRRANASNTWTVWYELAGV